MVYGRERRDHRDIDQVIYRGLFLGSPDQRDRPSTLVSISGMMKIHMAMQEGKTHRKIATGTSKAFLATRSTFAIPDVLVSDCRLSRIVVCKSVHVWNFGVDVGAGCGKWVTKV
jgi:hypothetical protein